MKKNQGIHFYININNLNSIIKKDEQNHDDLRRTFHALDTYTWAIEQFASGIAGLEIEKFTTSRYHFYLPCDTVNNNAQITAIIDLIVFSKSLAATLSTMGKYQSLTTFTIGIGADYGQYTEYLFTDPENGYDEMTTIGSPANRAAKLQSVCSDGKVLISKTLYDILSDNEKSVFFGNAMLSAKLALKYTGLKVYEARVYDLNSLVSKSYKQKDDEWLDNAKEHANSTNLSEIQFSEAKSQFNFPSLGLKNSKWAEDAVILYSDIRGFTHKVDNCDLAEIKQLTQIVLCGMNKAIRKESGIHVQFQGDRESTIFNSYYDEPNNHIVRSISAAMRMIDLVNEINESRNVDKLNIGIGCAIGTVFATRIGMRGQKFNVVMGEAVKAADTAEDEVAGVGLGNPTTEIAITKELFCLLNKVNTNQAKEYVKLFKKRCQNGKEYYVSTTGYKAFQDIVDKKTQDKNAERAKTNSGIRPWGM